MIIIQQTLAHSESTLLLVAIVLYLCALLSFWSHLFLRGDAPRTPRALRIARIGRQSPLWLGALLHALSLVGQGSALFFLQAGVVGLFGWILLLAFLISCARGEREIAIGAFVTPVVLIAAMYSLAAPPLHRFAPAQELQTPWLVVHVVIILVSYVALAFAFAASLIYLLQDSLLKQKKLGALWRKLPSLQVADEWIFRATSFGLACLTVGLLTGVLWQREHPDYAALRDPKVLASFFTWLIFAAYLGARLRLGWRGRKSNWVVVGGFVLLAISFLGTPHLLNGIS